MAFSRITINFLHTGFYFYHFDHPSKPCEAIKQNPEKQQRKSTQNPNTVIAFFALIGNIYIYIYISELQYIKIILENLSEK